VRARGCANGRDGKEKELEFYWIPQNYGEEKEVKERKRGEKKCPFWKKERESRQYFLQLECARCEDFVVRVRILSILLSFTSRHASNTFHEHVVRVDDRRSVRGRSRVEQARNGSHAGLVDACGCSHGIVGLQVSDGI